MKPRAIVFDLFGDYVRYAGGEAPLQVLVDLLGDFGVPASTSRVVMARLRREGWLDTRRDGRTTAYALNDRSWQLLDAGRRRIFEPARGPWDGLWRLVIYSVPETNRGARDRIRKRLAWLGFGPLASSSFVSPHARLDEAAHQLASETSVRLDLLEARSRGRDVDLDMVGRCWDLTILQADFVAEREALQARLARYRSVPPIGRDALVERIRLVAGYRRLPFRDPDLPAELLPRGWAGRDVHELFLEAYGLLGPEAQRYFREVTGRRQTLVVSNS